MNFQIKPLPASAVSDLNGLSDEALKRKGVKRVYADSYPGFPCRVSMQDALAGEPLFLLNYCHHDEDTAYRSSHAIFVRENAEQAELSVNHIPEVLSMRLLSVRGFNSEHDMVEADIVEGGQLGNSIDEFFKIDAIKYLHVHNAKRGCYAARVDRA